MRGHAEGYGPPDIASLMRALMGATGELTFGRHAARPSPDVALLTLRSSGLRSPRLLSEADHAK